MTATLLIADNDDAICAMLTQAARARGFASLATHQTDMLMQWVREGRGDVVIADMQLPVVFPAITEARPEMPIIAMSSQETQKQAGVFECLAKPFALNVLFSCIEKSLEKSSGFENSKLQAATLEKNVENHLTHYFNAHNDHLPAPGLYGRILPLVEKPLIAMTLRATQGNQVKAAAVLGINRNTLRKKIRELGIISEADA